MGSEATEGLDVYDWGSVRGREMHCVTMMMIAAARNIPMDTLVELSHIHSMDIVLFDARSRLTYLLGIFN